MDPKISEVPDINAKFVFFNFYRSIADRFDLSKSSLEKSFQTVISELETMASEIILWPTGQRLIDTVEGFKKTADFPGVIGAIDGTHINIKAPQVSNLFSHN